MDVKQFETGVYAQAYFAVRPPLNQVLPSVMSKHARTHTRTRTIFQCIASLKVFLVVARVDLQLNMGYSFLHIIIHTG